MNPTRCLLPSLLIALVATACAGPAPLPRQPLAPAAAPTTGPAGEDGLVERGFFERGRVRAEAAERLTPAAPTTVPAEPIEPNPARPAAPVFRSFVETVEVPVERVVEVEVQPRRYDRYDAYVGSRRAYRRRGTTPFPIGTAIGAGVGAIVGHQDGRRGRGALIGSGIGLLFDLDRWSRW
ncbi:MAG: glycine zipper family protein [Planctomycetota bacterium]